MHATGPDRTKWFADCGWGVFCHWLAASPSTQGGAALSAEAWNRQVDAFDAKGLAAQLASIGAPYFFITIGQNSGHFLAPNATYDRYTSIYPSKCSRRDLIGDLYDALQPRGIELLAYLPSGAPAADPVAVSRLESEHEDFTAGEIADVLPECPGPWVERNGHKARYHTLSYLGESWCKGNPRFSDERVADFTRQVVGQGGVMTWDVPIDKTGRIPPAFLRQLAGVEKTVALQRGTIGRNQP